MLCACLKQPGSKTDCVIAVHAYAAVLCSAFEMLMMSCCAYHCIAMLVEERQCDRAIERQERQERQSDRVNDRVTEWQMDRATRNRVTERRKATKQCSDRVDRATG